MKVNRFVRRACIAAVVLAWSGAGVLAQTPPAPSPAAIAMAKEILNLKGALALYSPVVPGVIEASKAALLQTNPMFGKDLNEVAAQLKTELAPRVREIEDNVFRDYASRFSEAEIKEVLTFYKSAAGKKVIIEEPKVLDASLNFADGWARQFSEEVLAKFRAEMKKRGHEM